MPDAPVPSPDVSHEAVPHDPTFPEGITRALAQVGGRMNTWIALDAALSGVASGAAVGVLTAAVARAAHLPAGLGVGASVVVTIAVGLREAKVRWVDAFGAASTLDTLLQAKDRFVSALHFSASAKQSSVHALQIMEASEFLQRSGPTPAPPRPRMRFHRFAVAAALVGLASLAVPVAGNAVARWVGHHRAFARPPAAAETPEAIAARAAALREALRDSPNRRIDAEINALDRALTAQAARVAQQRAQAIERAASVLDRARVAEPTTATADPNAAGPTAANQPAVPPEVRAAQQALAEARQARAEADAAQHASELQLRDAVTRLEAARRAGDPATAAAAQRQLDGLHAQIAQAQAAHDDAVRREGAAQQAMDPRRVAERPAATLDEAVGHLDRAMRAAEANDRTAATLPPQTGRALDQSARELGQQLPETASALRDAARAHAANDGQRMNEALERARASLSREAHAEPEELRRARAELDALHDQVAQNAQNAAEAAGNDARQGTGAQGDPRATLSREQQALRDAQEAERGRNGQTPPGAQSQNTQPGSQQGRQPGQASQPGTPQPGHAAGQPGTMSQAGQPGQQPGQPGQPGAAGRRPAAGQPGQPGQGGQPAPSGRMGQQGAWRTAGMTPAGAATGPSMSAPGNMPPGQGAADSSSRNGALGGDIGNDRGNSFGNGLTQGNRTAAMGGAGQQAVSRFNRGSGDTETDGASQMTAQGPGQAHGESGGGSGGGSGEGDPSVQPQGGRAWGAGAGDRLSLGQPGASGPFGHDVDPGGPLGRPPQLAPGARGVMMPGVAQQQQGPATGPTSEAPVAPGSLLPNAPGDGALAGALDEDPESTMTTQRVPPSLRAYVRRYFQRIGGGAAAPRP